MPQNELHENNNLEAAKVETGGRLTTGEYQICCAIMLHRRDCLECSSVMEEGREMAMVLVDHAHRHGISRLKNPLRN